MELVKRPDNNLQPSPGQSLAIRRGQEGQADFVPHLDLPEVEQLAKAAAATARTGKGERDALFIQTLCDGAFRVSEATSLCPNRLVQTDQGWVARIVGKGNKVRYAALSPTLVGKLLAYAYHKDIKPDQRIFPITSTRAWQILHRAFATTGIRKPDQVGSVHVLRHSGALARLRATGNPKATQEQLGHRTAKQTLRYMKTLAAKESIEIQQGVDFPWGA